MAWASTAPAARLNLISSVSAALPTVKIYNGQVVTGELITEAIVVGYQDPNVPASMSGQNISEGYAASPDREQYTINCAAVVATGADDYTPAIQRAFDLLAAVGQVTVTDPTLGGAVMVAQVGAWSMSEAVAQPATVVTLMFGVDIDAYTTV